MTLPLYFFQQFLSPFAFGTVLFLFVLMLDRLFDIIDLVFNKGVSFLVVGRLFLLFIPTAIPLTLPMAFLLGCLVTFGRLSEENELSAVRAAGISLSRVLWPVPLFALILSMALIPFNTQTAPWSNRAFRGIYEKIASADPLINIEPKKFFSIKNIKLFAYGVDKSSNRLTNLFVYQTTQEGRPAERIFAKEGVLRTEPSEFHLDLKNGQWDRFDPIDPNQLVHTTFVAYHLTLPMNQEKNSQSTRFRNFSTAELSKLIGDLKKQGLPTGPLEAERSLRIAIAFAPFALGLVGIPLATVLRRGGRGFGFGVSIVVIFIYYTLLVFGLTLAERSLLPSTFALWIANLVCIGTSLVLSFRLLRQ